MNRSLARVPPPAPHGPTKIVYVSEIPFDTDALTVIGPKKLTELMEDGWTVRTQTRRKITNNLGKPVTVDYITLEKVVERAVARRREDDEDSGDSIGTNSRSLTAGGGIGNVGSYLGGGSDFSGMPGIEVRTSKTLDNAFGMGVDCAKTGGTINDCPFPPGDKFHEQWMRGFHEAGGSAEEGKPSQEAMAEAYGFGKRAASGPPDLEVSCPYPPNSALYAEWLRGFKDAGGKIE